MEQIIDQILEMHRVGKEIDKQVLTCGYGDAFPPKWHILYPKDFVMVITALGHSVDDIRVKQDDIWYVEHRGVEIFVLTAGKEVPDLEALRTNRCEVQSGQA